MKSDFGIYFLKEEEYDHAPPKGFAWTSIKIGSFSERSLSSISIWGEQEYQLHWFSTARSIITHDVMGIFCSSINKHGLVLWIGNIINNNNISFTNRVVERRLIDLSGNIIKPKMGFFSDMEDDDNHISTWSIPLEVIKNYVDRLSL